MTGQRRRGAAGMQYALIVGLLAMAGIIAVATLGLRIEGLFGRTGGALTGAVNGIGANGSSGPTGPDTTPDNFSFPGKSASLSVATESDAVTITGFEGSLTASVTGDGAPQLSVAGGAWGSSGSITAGQTLRLRLSSAPTANTARTATVTVGGVNASWTVTTATVATTCAGLLAAGFTADGTYMIDPDGSGPHSPISATCDMTTDGGGWTLVTDYNNVGAGMTVDIHSGLAPYIDANILTLESRIEAGITSSGRVYKRFLRNTRYVETYAGTEIYFAQCKLAWGDSYAGDDHGLNKNLFTGYQTGHSSCENRTASDFRCNVVSACHRSLRSADGNTYVAQTGTYFSGWNAYCGGMPVYNYSYAGGCATTHTFATTGPESYINPGTYLDFFPAGRHRTWIK